MDIVIKVEKLSKKYLIRHEDNVRYNTLRDVITNSAKNISSIIKNQLHNNKVNKSRIEDFWALKDVSFEIKQGERVGIIGRNGAGKSTLLKILSRITEPTVGSIRLKGRVSSLLEVGTGFHPELTGRENIYLNGAILGMSKLEIKKKFYEIVAFSDVENFLDTPVKRYSSGMQVRLAFAVAAHLEPEILLVDEVLAVGDAQFQKKCLGKMGEVSKEGRTILFVSHNMGAIEQLCSRGILLEKGIIKQQTNDVGKMIKDYLIGSEANFFNSEWTNFSREYSNPLFTPEKVYIADINGNRIIMPIRKDSEAWLYIEGEVKTLVSDLTIGYAIYSEIDHLLFWSLHTDKPEKYWPKINKGKNILRTKLPVNQLNEGSYRIELLASLHNKKWLFEPLANTPCIYLTIRGGLSSSPYWMQKRPGLFAPELEWELF